MFFFCTLLKLYKTYINSNWLDSVKHQWQRFIENFVDQATNNKISL